MFAMFGPLSASPRLAAIVVTDAHTPISEPMITAALREMTDAGYQTLVLEHHGDLSSETAILAGLVQTGTSAILMEPADILRSSDTVETLRRSGASVVIVGTPLKNDGFASAQVYADEVRCARMGAAEMADLIGQGTYFELFGSPDDPQAEVRSGAFREEMQQHSLIDRTGFEVADGSYEMARLLTFSMMSTDWTVEGILAADDPMALGAVDTLRELGQLDQVAVGGFGGTADALLAVQNGDLAFTVILPQAQIGTIAAKAAISVAKTGSTGLIHEREMLDCTLFARSEVTSP